MDTNVGGRGHERVWLQASGHGCTLASPPQMAFESIKIDNPCHRHRGRVLYPAIYYYYCPTYLIPDLDHSSVLQDSCNMGQLPAAQLKPENYCTHI